MLQDCMLRVGAVSTVKCTSHTTYINCCRIAIHMCATPVDKDWLVKKCYIRPLLDRQIYHTMIRIRITAKK